MRKSLVLSLAAVAALGAGTAYARGEARPEPRAMTRADVEQRTSAMFARMDANADGVLDAADREATRREAFGRIDADGDGSISFAEFETRRDGRRQSRAGRDRARPAFGHRGMTRTADADNDGTVTAAEFTTAALARFDKADANGDGTISLEERREARQHMRHNMRRGRPARGAG